MGGRPSRATDTCLCGHVGEGAVDREIEENLDLLEIMNFIPHTNAGCAAAVDILISSVRNILIRKLANHGEYVFSWEQILRAARRHGMIGSDDAPVFLAARHRKNLYRQGILPRTELGYLERLVEGADKVFESHTGCRFARRPVLRALPDRCGEGTYKQLRALELVCAEYEFDHSLGRLIAMVRQPSYFVANGPSRAMQRTSANGTSLAFTGR